MRALLLVAALSLVTATLAADAPKKKPVACAIDGSPVHWMADYCMATLQTDDEIPANFCIKEEMEIRYPDDCAAKRFYKRRLCELAVHQRTRKGNVDDCMLDGAFMGRTVRNRGVKGR